MSNITVNNNYNLITNQHEESILKQVLQQFAKATAQAVHDIQSPLACLLMLCKQSQLASSKQSVVNPDVVVARINKILSNLPQAIENEIINVQESMQQEVILDQEIKNILAEKYCEYADSTVVLEYNATQNANNVAIPGNPDAFSRMLSNLLNNAVEACCDKPGVVNIKLDADDTRVYLTIQDNGIGMSDEIKHKILNHIAVTANKANGHGIGFGQIHETLIKSNGQLIIESKIGVGTKTTLVFPKH